MLVGRRLKFLRFVQVQLSGPDTGDVRLRKPRSLPPLVLRCWLGVSRAMGSVAVAWG